MFRQNGSKSRVTIDEKHTYQVIRTKMSDILTFYCSSIVLNTIAYCFSIVCRSSKCVTAPSNAWRLTSMHCSHIGLGSGKGGTMVRSWSVVLVGGGQFSLCFRIATQ